MSDYAESIAAIGRARQARDLARAELYALQLGRLALDRARQKDTRGEQPTDPALATTLRPLRSEIIAASTRRDAIAKRLTELASVPAALRELRDSVQSATAQRATLVRQVALLSRVLEEQQAPDARARAADAVREAQSRRAAFDISAKQDLEAIAPTQALAEEALGLREEVAALDRRLRELNARVDDATRQGVDVDLRRDEERNRSAVTTKRKEVDRLEAGVREAVVTLYDGRTPQELIASWDDDIPIALLPLRVETRWKPDATTAPELWVRVYPDDVAVTTHESVLTAAEVERGRAYWTAFRAANSNAEAEASAWRAVADRFGVNRAAWVAHETRPLNWDAATVDASASLQFPEPPLVKADAWTVAPHSRVLPDRYVLLAWRGDELRINEVGNPIDDVVVLGPSPIEDPDGGPSLARNVADKSILVGESFRWVREFDRAIAQGMGFRVPVSADDVARGFDRLLVLGLKASADASDAQGLVESLIDDHHYSHAGFEIVRQGTPTNNTDGNDSGYTRDIRASSETTLAETGPALFTPTPDRAVARDGQRLADFLGTSYAPLLHASGAGNADHAEAVAMNRALYAGTLGYYVDHMINEVIDERAVGVLRRHFTDQVTGRGPLAAIRVGSQPYGILPTSSLGRWVPSARRKDVTVALLPAATDPFEATLLAVLRRFDQAWSAVVPRLVQVHSGSNGAANLLQILGLHPNSVELYQRVGYSFDYLKNLEAFAWEGSGLGDAIRMMIEGMSARTLLRDLGYETQGSDANKPNPLLLQLIWRHYQTRLDPKQLIDGQPLSESRFITPYDAAGTKTYLDWLLAHTADATALETQDFGGAPRPGSLLYLMLHFSLVMEAGRGIHRWLADRNVNGDELVRSRKFLNIGSPSPSVWEVFRAPANRIVATESSDRTLLELVHAPQHATDAGQNVREQRDALDTLRTMPTARLERALVEHVDTLSYRLDAWETSLFARRLHRQRNLDAPVANRRTGVYLGAYGYLENVKPNGGRRQKVADDSLPEALRQGRDDLYADATNGGFVHAPSLNHATAAALLRNGYLTHATPADPNALAVNLSSGRVERAKSLLDGIRNGQSLEVLLGVQFERGLHDWTTRSPNPVILDDLKPLFRTQFPILRTRVPQANDASAGASEVSEDHAVVNGLTLARTTTTFPYGIAELAALSANQQAAIRGEKLRIEDTLDALRDVLTAESAYQLALGNFDRAAAVLQSAGSGTAPPDLEVLDTPRGTAISFTQRLAVQLAVVGAGNPWAPIALTERARLEPSLNAWLGDLIGDPTGIVCTAAALDTGGAVLVVGGAPMEDRVTLADLGLQPIDFVYVVRSQVDESGAAELESRVRQAFAQKHAISDNVVVRITFAESGNPSVRSFAEALPLADRLRRLLGTARPLDGRHFQSASKDTPAPTGNPGRIDAVELRLRVDVRISAVRDLFPLLRAAADAVRAATTVATVTVLRDALIAVANAGVTYAVPRSAVGFGAAQAALLLAQADELLSRSAALDLATDEQFTAADAAAAAEDKASILAGIVKAWMGSDMLVLPRFVYHDAAVVAQADAARDELLSYARDTVHVPLPVEEWLHGVACVRPLVHDFEMVRVMADAVRDEPLILSPIQLPFRTGDRWLGAQYPENTEVVHDTVSIVQHLPNGFVAPGAQCGLLIDEWLETVPNREGVTGLCFNYDAPNSAPPQTLLLAVTPNETGRWEWDDLVDSVLDTFRRARIRAVEPDALGDLPGIGTLIPAVIAEFGTSAASVSLDYSFVLSEISVPVLAMMADRTNGG